MAKDQKEKTTTEECTSQEGGTGTGGGCGGKTGKLSYPDPNKKPADA